MKKEDPPTREYEVDSRSKSDTSTELSNVDPFYDNDHIKCQIILPVYRDPGHYRTYQLISVFSFLYLIGVFIVEYFIFSSKAVFPIRVCVTAVLALSQAVSLVTFVHFQRLQNRPEIGELMTLDCTANKKGLKLKGRLDRQIARTVQIPWSMVNGIHDYSDARISQHVAVSIDELWAEDHYLPTPYIPLPLHAHNELFQVVHRLKHSQ